jgi:streptogrisin C
MNRRLTQAAASAALLIGAAFLATTPSSAAASQTPGDDGATPAATPSPGASDMVDALQRDLGLTGRQVLDRLAKELAASQTQRQLRSELGDRFAGAWLAADQRLVVATTDARQAARVRALGAEPRVVARSERQLQAVMTKLNTSGAPSSVSSWYVDVESNIVVVRTDTTALPAAVQFVRASGVAPDAVRIEGSSEVLRPFYNLRGGDKIGVPGGSCSLGFSIRHSIPNQVDPPGFVTAGHCLDQDDDTSGYNGVAQGTTMGSVFPGNGDYAWVQVNSNWSPQPWVNRYGGRTILIHGAQPAPIGGAVCRSGYASGFRCGQIQATNVTANYAGGNTVTGLTRTSACATFGDSGGPFLAVTQAQGILSGGAGDCSNGGTTLFQPLQEILDAYDLRLIVTQAPWISNTICEYGGNGKYLCSVFYVSPSAVQIRWIVNSVARPAWNNLAHVSGTCGIGSVVGVNATVTNGNGSATASDSFLCEGPPV